MEKFRSFPFYLFFFTLFTCNHYATSQDDICKTVFCGMGTCQQSDREILFGFRCDCGPGWEEYSFVGPTTPIQFPSCIIPNCAFDSQCGFPSPISPPSPDVSNPCLLNLCGAGTCERNGLFDFTCQCNDGAANLLKNPKLPCFPKCAIGAKCNGGIDLGFGSPPPPPPPQKSGSPRNGSDKMPNCSSELHVLTTVILATILLNWI